MTEINIFRNQDGHIIEYEISGHADFDEYGRDILCAAISVLSQTSILALEKVCEISQENISFFVDEKTGYLKVSLTDNLTKGQRESASIVLESMLVGMEDLAFQYPNYIKLIDKEE